MNIDKINEHKQCVSIAVTKLAVVLRVTGSINHDKYLEKSCRC